MSKVFSRTGNLRPGRSVFNKSHIKLMDVLMGNLYPSMCLLMVPGDKFTIANKIVVRFGPMFKPVLHEINLYIHYFFVPLRILWDQWETFITRGVSGNEAPVLPRWSTGSVAIGRYSLWDYFGFPTDVSVPNNDCPTAFPLRAYNMVFNEYYRDENYTSEVDINDVNLKRRSWEKDYFTSAMPSQQRGDNLAIPLLGYSTAKWAPARFTSGVGGDLPVEAVLSPIDNLGAFNSTTSEGANRINYMFNANYVDLTLNASSVDIAMLRRLVQLQKFMERNMRAGVRYEEWVPAHFNVTPGDARVNRPEYIGGVKMPVIFSEVLQTSASPNPGTEGSPQGTLAGHGILADGNYAGKYFAREYGVCLGMMSIMPRSGYSSQGIDREWSQLTSYDFYVPEFAHLSEQPIKAKELRAVPDTVENNRVIGFQGIFDELRQSRNMAVGSFRDSLKMWHLMRDFSAPPYINTSFLQVDPWQQQRIFNIPGTQTNPVPNLLVQCANLVKAVRPLPIMSNPGMMDHF